MRLILSTLSEHWITRPAMCIALNLRKESNDYVHEELTSHWKSVDVSIEQVSEKQCRLFVWSELSCVLANATVFPKGSRCASQPCQNGGVCFDFPSADAYACHCYYPYQGLHCHLTMHRCGRCGGPITKTTKITPLCRSYTSDMALNYTCACYDNRNNSRAVSYALNDCLHKEPYVLKCDEEHLVGALPFTNKGFYNCPFGNLMLIESCRLHHVWNDTRKECVPELH